jgi:CubicO group peptidase (beta-lactamase class C family)
MQAKPVIRRETEETRRRRRTPAFAGVTLAAALGITALLASPASAQDSTYTRALAAGYKASFLCSNIFNGGLTEAQTERDDLTGTYGELNPIFPTLEARIDREARVVAVPFAEGLPPRIAAWRPNLGCAQLPIGAPREAAAVLPRMDREAPDLDAQPWPTGDRNAAGRLAGDRRGLDRAVARAFDRRSFGQGSETTAVIVVQNGRIVAERYRDDFNMHMSQRTWSVAKSIAATVIGAAAQQGLTDVSRPAHVPEWRTPGDPRQAITTDHLLRMASGLHSESAGNRTDALYFGGTAVAEQAAGWPIAAPPGTRFRYANNDTVLAIRGLQHLLGDGEASRAFPFTHLLWKIGMTRTVPETDWRGHFILSSQVWTTARDLARLGLLHQNDGVWNGERILPEGWRDYVHRRGAAQPPSGYGYGSGWWTFPSASGLPADAIVARGNRGQFVAVIPSRRLVIVRRGFDGTGMTFDLDPFVREVLAALE